MYSGVCASDLSTWKGHWPRQATLPLIAGHEGAGLVVAIANDTTTDLKVGDRVGVKLVGTTCLSCHNCRAGFEISCAHAQTHGDSIDGTLSQYCVSFTNHLTPIPDNVPLEYAAPILCAGVTVLRALKESSARPGDWVCIAGAGGGLGHLAVQYAKALNLRVIAIDTGKDKEAMVKSYGADVWLDFKDAGNMVERIQAASDG